MIFMIPTADFDTVIAGHASSSLEKRISAVAVQQEEPVALAQATARSLIDSAYHSFETQYHSQEFVANYTSFKQEAVASLKKQLKVLRDQQTDDAVKKVFDNYYRAAQLQFAQKEKSLEKTVAVDYTQPASYRSDKYLCSTVVTNPSLESVAGAIGALGIGFAMARKRRRNKKPNTELTASQTLIPDDARALLPAVADEEIIEGEDDELDKANDSDKAADASGLDLSLARILPLERVSETYLSASKAISEFTESPTNPGVASVQGHTSEKINPSAAHIIIRGDTASTGYESKKRVSLDAGVMDDQTHFPLSRLSVSAAKKQSRWSKAVLWGSGVVTGLAAAVTLSVSAATYFAYHVSSPEHTNQAVYSSQQTAPSAQPIYSNPVSTAPQTQPAAPTAEIKQPNAHGVSYFPQHAPKNELGGKNLSADWYQIKYAAQTVDSFILQVGSDVSLDGRVARLGIDTDGNGKADKIIYKSLDHQLKLPLSNGETVVHAGYGVKSDSGFTYLASVSKTSGDIQYRVVSQN